jgi:hypothetical protein
MESMTGENLPPRGVLLTLPDWLADVVSGPEIVLPDPEERLRWVIGLSRQNVERGSGGPFAAGVFDANSGRLIAAGVASSSASAARAEIWLAFAGAESRRFRAAWRSTELTSPSLPDVPGRRLVVRHLPADL